MFVYFIDFLTVAAFVIGITAINGVLTNTIGNKLFGRKGKSQFVDQSMSVQTGWRKVGGKA